MVDKGSNVIYASYHRVITPSRYILGYRKALIVDINRDNDNPIGFEDEVMIKKSLLRNREEYRSEIEKRKVRRRGKIKI